MIKITFGMVDQLKYTVRDSLTKEIKKVGYNKSSNTVTNWGKQQIVKLVGNIGTGDPINAVDAYRGSWSRDSSPTVERSGSSTVVTSSTFTTAGTYTTVHTTHTSETTGGANHHTKHTIN